MMLPIIKIIAYDFKSINHKLATDAPNVFRTPISFNRLPVSAMVVFVRLKQAINRIMPPKAAKMKRAMEGIGNRRSD